MLRTILAALFAALLLLPAAARDVTSAEDAALADRIASFDNAIRERDFAEVMAIIPPKILATIGEQNNVDVDTLKAAITEQMQSAFEDVELEFFEMRLDAAERRELEDGTPYLLLPTTTRLDMEETGRVEFNNTTLALMDEGVWYLLRLDDPNQIAILRQTYPMFEGVPFPRGTMTSLDDK